MNQQTQKTFKLEFVPADASLDFKIYGKYIAFLRRQPVHAVRLLWQIVIPPHEGFMLRKAWEGYSDNIYLCSRGTSKSFTIGSLYPATKGLLFRGNRFLVASASMFRGGKLILKDVARLLKGSLYSQKIGNNWGVQSLLHKPNAIKKEPDMWYAEYTSNSMVFTIPTNKEESIRGIRATTLILDERNNFDGEIIQKVYRPFLAVGSDFENTAAGSKDNQMFYVGTIDYTFRDWYKEILAYQDIAKVQYEIQKALREQNWTVYRKLMQDYGGKIREASISIVRYDYTDLLIPMQIDSYKVNYPGLVEEKHVRWDERDQVKYIYTYPVQKKQLEDPLDQGIVDQEIWNAEQRNVFISADGNVYPPSLVEKATGPIFSATEETKKGWNAVEEGIRYLPPILPECSDPCILGVDVARIQDYSAFVVIRIGDLPSDLARNNNKSYDLKQHTGPSNFSNVIWCEQQQHTTIKEVASTIRELRSRYNLVGTIACPGVIMDARGGGTSVRDELVNPSPEIDTNSGLPLPGWTPPQRIFDPEDKEDKLGRDLLYDPSSWPGLRLLWTTEILNQELVSFSKAQLQTSKLFIGNPKFSKMPKVGDPLYLGTVGVTVLKHQLLRIQAVSSPSGKTIQYIMPGDPTRPENKKDMMFAFLYACYGLRSWITQQIKVSDYFPPTTYGEAFVIGR